MTRPHGRATEESVSTEASQSIIRFALLFILLAAEITLVFSLRLLGWNETGSAIRWITALLIAILPLTIAATLLIAHRFRFGLRTLLIATALVALFLMVTLMPLQNAFNLRRVSRQVLAAGAEIRTESSFRDVYKEFGYEPWPESSLTARNEQLPIWLHPLAGELLTIPNDDAVKCISLSSDAQITVVCRELAALRNLECISIYGAVTPAGMEMLRQSLKEFPHLTDLHIGIDVPKGWLRSLEQLRTLWLWVESLQPARRLSADLLRDIPALPDLRVLRIHTYAVNDGDMEVLSGCNLLRYLILRNTAVTDAGEQQFFAALPKCVVDRE
jgi:hypothetical protein